MDDPICYELRIISIATGSSMKCYSPKSFPSSKASLELSFSRIMHAHILIVLDFCSAQHMQLLPRPAYSQDMSPIERVWDFVGRRLTRDPRPAFSKDKLLLYVQAIWNSLPQADIQNMTPCHVYCSTYCSAWGLHRILVWDT
ncbi:transposable element Tcb2 transposase [Trichonephila clavipes]|nr:transposable element Tcb2 transposase [Trichonephila clavipes]